MLHYDILVKRKENQTLYRAKNILHMHLLEVENKQGGAYEMKTLCSLQFEALRSEVFDASALLSLTCTSVCSSGHSRIRT